MSAIAPELERDHALLDLAARGAVRGHGHVEPNPLVGCVLTDEAGDVIAAAHHGCFGAQHAEILALEKAGERVRGGTMHVTLEPCNHEGRTGPCTEAIIGAGVNRVVIGHRDPNPEAAGGAMRLQAAGIEVDVLEHEPSRRLLEPFLVRWTQRRPWVIAKWAQTLDGRLATRTGHSRWISNEQSRRLVHRERGRVDVVLSGIGTILADDPRLTARDGRRRRIARRVIVDPRLRIPDEAALLQTVHDAPVTIACLENASSDRQHELQERGVDVLPLPEQVDRIDLRNLLEHLQARYDCTNVLVEAGPGLLSALAEAGCIDEALVIVAPLLLGDTQAIPVLQGRGPETIPEGLSLALRHVHRRGDDVVLRYGTGSGAGTGSP